MTMALTKDRVELSNGEWRALVVKAARGAGMDWGSAEEAGWAVEWLSRRGLPAADWVADWLATDQGPCPIACGIALADGFPAPGQGLPALPAGLRAPGLVLPFLVRGAGGHALAVMAPGGVVASLAIDGAITFGPLWSARSADNWQLHWAAEVRQVADRPLVGADLLQQLHALSMRTNVPASAISRQGAGAASSDND